MIVADRYFVDKTKPGVLFVKAMYKHTTTMESIVLIKVYGRVNQNPKSGDPEKDIYFFPGPKLILTTKTWGQETRAVIELSAHQTIVCSASTKIEDLITAIEENLALQHRR